VLVVAIHPGRQGERSETLTQKHDQPVAGRDHLLQSRPLRHRELAPRGIRKLGQAGRRHGRAEHADRRPVAVGEEERDNLVRVRHHPRVDRGQVRDQGAGVLLCTGRMAQLQDATLQMRLGLEEPDPAIQLRRDRLQLVVGWQDAHECGVMGPDKRDVRVLAATERRIAIARLCRDGADEEEERRNNREEHGV